MALLAEQKRKQKFGVDPRNVNWSNDDTKIGQRLMEKMGWEKGRGLGANENGMTENVKAVYKADTRGLGCTPKDADAWIAHQDDFNDLLKNLNSSNSTAESSSKIQERPPDGQKRYYGRFARGQVKTLRSTEDLNCIFGKRKKALGAESSSSSDDDDKTHGVMTVRSNLSLQEYFAKKMADLKTRQQNVQETDSTTSDNQQVEISMEASTLEIFDCTQVSQGTADVCIAGDYSLINCDNMQGTDSAADDQVDLNKAMASEIYSSSSNSTIDGKKKKKHKKSKTSVEEQDRIEDNIKYDNTNGKKMKKQKRKSKNDVDERDKTDGNKKADNFCDKNVQNIDTIDVQVDTSKMSRIPGIYSATHFSYDKNVKEVDSCKNIHQVEASKEPRVPGIFGAVQFNYETKDDKQNKDVKRKKTKNKRSFGDIEGSSDYLKAEIVSDKELNDEKNPIDIKKSKKKKYKKNKVIESNRSINEESLKRKHDEDNESVVTVKCKRFKFDEETTTENIPKKLTEKKCKQFEVINELDVVTSDKKVGKKSKKKVLAVSLEASFDQVNETRNNEKIIHSNNKSCTPEISLDSADVIKESVIFQENGSKRMKKRKEKQKELSELSIEIDESVKTKKKSKNIFTFNEVELTVTVKSNKKENCLLNSGSKSNVVESPSNAKQNTLAESESNSVLTVKKKTKKKKRIQEGNKMDSLFPGSNLIEIPGYVSNMNK